MLGKGKAEALDDGAFEALAIEFGCHPADLEAIAEVESKGFGWFPDGRIKILFEKHRFYKNLTRDQRKQAVASRLARRKWLSPKMGGYKEQNSADSRYAILQRAININEEAALQSVSMGTYQIMGFNAKLCGFANARDMWSAFLDSENNQLRAFATYLDKTGLVPALRRGDFEAIEKGYNGGGLKGAYARKMAAAADRLRAGKWKDWNPEDYNVRSHPIEDLKKVPVPKPKPKPQAQPGSSGFFSALSALILKILELFK
jgi:hypothetical protein